MGAFEESGMRVITKELLLKEYVGSQVKLKMSTSGASKPLRAIPMTFMF